MHNDEEISDYDEELNAELFQDDVNHDESPAADLSKVVETFKKPRQYFPEVWIWHEFNVR